MTGKVCKDSMGQGWIQHDLVGGGGGGMLSQLWCRVVSVMYTAHPPTTVHLNCNKGIPDGFPCRIV